MMTARPAASARAAASWFTIPSCIQGPDRNGILDNGERRSRVAEDVDKVHLRRDDPQVRVADLVQDFILAGIDWYYPVAGGHQVARHPVAGPPRLGGKADHRDGCRLPQNPAD